MILLNLSLVICAAPVVAEEISMKNLEMMVVMEVVVMVVRIVVMKMKSTVNANAMLMIGHAGLDAMNALKISSEANLKVMAKEKNQKKSHLHQWVSSAWMSVKHAPSK